ncbi:Histone deacetylase hda1 [Coemansia sp. Benny D115]|nr:Histone deacetylase hda1 [Coemansia sp. Benny D115]
MDKVGKDAGRGFNINIPWAAGGVGDGDYLYAFRNIVIPVAHEFAPDLIIVASGFDAAACDPIGECFVTPEGYACMTSMLRGVGNGRLVLSLEGGYNLDAIANSALGCVKALLGIRWKAGVTPECAAYNAYATLSIAEVNGVPMGNPTYSEAWKALPDWDPAFEVPNCFHSSPTPMGRDVVDEVVRVHSQFWSCLNKQP